MHRLLVEVANAYPKGSPTSRLAVRTFRVLETLRIQLYDNAIEENPGEAGPATCATCATSTGRRSAHGRVLPRLRFPGKPPP